MSLAVVVNEHDAGGSDETGSKEEARRFSDHDNTSTVSSSDLSEDEGQNRTLTRVARGLSSHTLSEFLTVLLAANVEELTLSEKVKGQQK
jgi:hypothetical protein